MIDTRQKTSKTVSLVARVLVKDKETISGFIAEHTNLNMSEFIRVAVDEKLERMQLEINEGAGVI